MKFNSFNHIQINLLAQSNKGKPKHAAGFQPAAYKNYIATE